MLELVNITQPYATAECGFARDSDRRVQAGHRLRFRPGTSFTLLVQILMSKFVVVAAVGTVEKRLLFFHGFHSPSVDWVHLAPCQPVAGLMFLVLSSSIPRR